jgi:hypothetical protein
VNYKRDMYEKTKNALVRLLLDTRFQRQLIGKNCGIFTSTHRAVYSRIKLTLVIAVWLDHVFRIPVDHAHFFLDGLGLIPTPNPNRSPIMTPRLDSCLATIADWRMANLITEVVKRSFSVIAARQGMAMKGSRKGTPSRNSRVPSSL